MKVVDWIAKLKRPLVPAPTEENISLHYAGRASVYGWAANFWLVLSCVATGGVVVVSYNFMTSIPPVSSVGNEAWVELVRSALPGLLIVGILAWGTRQFVRNYQVSKHLQAAYEQRQATLATFKMLREAATETWAKDRVSLLLAASVVTPIETGYLSHKEDDKLDAQVMSTLNRFLGQDK